jgi:hypothetical protein
MPLFKCGVLVTSEKCSVYLLTLRVMTLNFLCEQFGVYRTKQTEMQTENVPQ